MKFWNHWTFALVLLFAVGVLAGPLVIGQDLEQEAKLEEPGFIHVVYFWMKEDAPDTAVDQLIADCKQYLGEIKTVDGLYVGRPAGTEREVVDNSYGVNLIIHFKNKVAHDFYQQAPLHKEFIERNQEHWDRVQVYDMMPE
jgi:hypothetical protein